MIIKHVENSICPMTDTDTLPDVQALILEKSEELRQLCVSNNRQCFILVDSKGIGREGGSSTFFWSFSTSPEINALDYSALMNKLNHAIYQISGKTITLSQIPPV